MEDSKKKLTKGGTQPNIVLGSIPVVYGRYINGGSQIAFWCPFCRCVHYHGGGGGNGGGHRVAHCADATSPFQVTGYDVQPWPEIEHESDCAARLFGRECDSECWKRQTQRV